MKHRPDKYSLARLVLINRQRRRRDLRRNAPLRRGEKVFFSLALLISLLGAALAIGIPLGYRSLTADLPSVDQLAVLLDEEQGLLRQPSRLVDRSGQHTLLVLSPQEGERQFLTYDQFPESLVLATLVLSQPDFWDSPGYVLDGWRDPDSHPTLAQQLVFKFLLADEAPTPRRAFRERLLAADLVANYSHEQLLAWFLNSSDYGHYAVGADSAAQLYFGKSASDLSLSEAAMLAFVGQAPALNPLDAPYAADAGRREVLASLLKAGWITQPEALASARELPLIQPQEDDEAGLVSDQFILLALAQLDARLGVGRAQRGGAVIYTSLDYSLQLQADCTLGTQLARLAGREEPFTTRDGSPCDAATLLPWMDRSEELSDLGAGALVLDPLTGQILAAAGDLSHHPAGTAVTPFIYLAGFARGLSPATLGWDIPSGEPDLGQVYQGPVRLRTALVNDYLPPTRTLIAQVGIETVHRTAASLGLDLPTASLLEEDLLLSPFALSSAYGILAAEGRWVGQDIVPSAGVPSLSRGSGLDPAAVLLLTHEDGSTWQDWSASSGRLILTPQLAWLVTDVLADESARPANLSTEWLDIGRQAAVRQARTLDGSGAWTVGYTPLRVVTVFLSGAGSDSRLASDGLWSALAQASLQNQPAAAFDMPPGLVSLRVCDPSGMLPTDACQNVVDEIFLEGSEPIGYDTLFQEIEVNKETGQLATVFTPVEMVEKRIYLVPPASARDWAQAAGLDVPPSSYDAYEVPKALPEVHITSPIMFSDGHGLVEIRGTASGEDFVSYRLEYGAGLNPGSWYQLGEDISAPVTEGLLGEWNTTGLDGVYTLRLMVLRSEGRLEEALLQLTLDNTLPVVTIQYPAEGQELSLAEVPYILYKSEVQEAFLEQVVFYLDGEQVGSATTAPFWFILPAELGKHVLRVEAVDRVGNMGQAEVHFTVVK